MLINRRIVTNIPARFLIIGALLFTLGLSSCGGRSASIAELASTPLQGSGAQTAAVAATTADYRAPDPKAFYVPKMALEEKLGLIALDFGCPEYSGQVAEPGEPLRYPDRMVIYFQRGLNLKDVNTQRAAITAQQLQEITLPAGHTEDVREVRPVQIDAQFANARPAPEQHQHPALLRNREYVPLARFLADQYNLDITSETYYGYCNWSVMRVAEGSDVQQVAALIQRENNDIVREIGADLAAFPFGYDPRYEDSEMDDYFDQSGQPSDSYGARILDLHGSGHDNGVDYWDYGEGYGYFQAEAQKPHSSWWAPDPYQLGEVLPGIDCRCFVGDSGVDPELWDLPYELESYGIPATLIMPVDPDYPGDTTFWDTSTGPNDPKDHFVDVLSNYHGTKVAGIVGARGNNNFGIAGMIPHGEVIPFKLCTENGQTSPVMMSDALLRAYSVRDYYSCYVYSSSWGGQYVGGRSVRLGPPEPWKSAVDTIRGDKIPEGGTEPDPDPSFISMFACGNYNMPVITPYIDPHDGFYKYDISVFPAAIAFWDGLEFDEDSDGDGQPEHYAFDYGGQFWSIMAVDKDDERSIYTGIFASDYASEEAPNSVTLSAPGGSGTTGTLAPAAENQFETFNGTSCAAPHVAGVAAMVQNYAPELTAAEVRDHLQATARHEQWGDMPPPMGPGLPELVEPIVSAGQALPWIDIQAPAYNPRNPGDFEVILAQEPTTLVALYYLPEGVLQDNQANATVTFVISDPDPAVSIQIEATLVGPALWDDAYHKYYSALAVFAGSNYPAIDGRVSMFAVLSLDNGRMPLRSHPVEFYVQQSPGSAWDKTVIETFGAGRAAWDCAITDSTNSSLVDRTYVGYFVHDYNLSTYDVRLATETAPLSGSFSVATAESAPIASGVTFRDPTIDYGGYGLNGVHYQRKGDYGRGLEYRGYFGHAGGTIPDVGSENHLNPIAGSYRTADTGRRFALHNQDIGGTIRWFIGQRDWAGMWYPPVPLWDVPAGQTEVASLLNCNLRWDVNPPDLRAIGEVIDSHPPDPVDGLQVYYKHLDPNTGAWQSERVPRLDPGFFGQTYIGCSRTVAGGIVDSRWTPAVFTRTQNSQISPPQASAVEVALDTEDQGFVSYLVEPCFNFGVNSTSFHGTRGDADYRVVKRFAFLAYLSGVQSVLQSPLDQGDLKIAYIQQNYDHGELEWSDPVSCPKVVIDDDASYFGGPVKVGIVQGRIVVAYFRSIDEDTTQLVVAYEPVYP